ncbi:Lsr2 family protein [Streptomyces sp. NPDC057002]|uniref:histone-like nucleoid-structuring protein Lsr2 n=1 Tax=Streptomyces sp. NPDC057002 TaxID=3345992 RepID=UPI00362E2C1C
MATKRIVLLLDDLANDGETLADETVPFSLDGVDYEIDLSNENAHRLRARLKEFKQAGRVVSKSRKRTARPMTQPAGDGATLSRHQGGQDPAAVRAWAVNKGLLEAGGRGRLSSRIKEAYAASKFDDDGPLNELLAELKEQPAADATPTREVQPEAEAQPGAGETLADLDEAEAKKHYAPLARRSERAADDAYWKRRTSGEHKVEDMTLVQRIEMLTPFNVKILGKLAGHLNLDKGGKVSGLKTSAAKLENLEMIQVDPDSPHGFSSTPFGDYAFKLHSMGE